MTDKIIDGIDVSGCEFYIDNYKFSCDLSFINKENLCSCNEIDDCYYKQLKRLEFENKLIKADYEASEQENARLKEEIELFRNAHDTEQSRRRKFENCLDEIKEYCEKCKNCVETGDEVILYTILQKISEVEE